MKCPYTTDTEQVNQTNYEYDDDGKTIFYEHKMVEHQTYIECLKEECGAYNDGRCRYKD